MDKSSMHYHDCLHIYIYIYHLIKDITVNCLRNGATVQTYTVPNSDNSAAGRYTCMVTVSTVASSEGSVFSLGVTGIVVCYFTDLKVFE